MIPTNEASHAVSVVVPLRALLRNRLACAWDKPNDKVRG
jgi:hypothetical protein